MIPAGDRESDAPLALPAGLNVGLPGAIGPNPHGDRVLTGRGRWNEAVGVADNRLHLEHTRPAALSLPRADDEGFCFPAHRHHPQAGARGEQGDAILAFAPQEQCKTVSGGPAASSGEEERVAEGCVGHLSGKPARQEQAEAGETNSALGGAT